VKTGLRPADGLPRAKADRHLPSLEPPVAESQSRARKLARRVGLVGASALGAGLSWLALQRIGIDKIGASLLKATPRPSRRPSPAVSTSWAASTSS